MKIKTMAIVSGMLSILCSSCEKELVVEGLGEPNSSLNIITRADGGDVSYPITIYVMNKDNTCIKKETIASSEQSLSLDMEAAQYTIYAIAGATTTNYNLPDKDDVTPTTEIALLEGKKHADLMTASSAVEISADPADGSTVEKLSQVTITFTGASNVDQGSAASSSTITSDKGYSAGVSLAYGTNENQMVVSFTEVTEEATYTLTFPENAFSAEDATIPAFTLTYKIGEEQAEGLLLTPAGGTVTWLTDIAVAYAAAPTKSLSTNWNATEKPTLTGPDNTEIVIDINSIYDSNVGYSTYHIMPRLLITTPGEYTLTIPDDYFSCGLQ